MGSECSEVLCDILAFWGEDRYDMRAQNQQEGNLLENCNRRQVDHSFAAMILTEILFERGLVNKETMDAVRKKVENILHQALQAA